MTRELPEHRIEGGNRPRQDRVDVACVCGEYFYVDLKTRDQSERSAAVTKIFADLNAHIWSTRPLVTGREIPLSEAVSLIGEGTHTGLRKGSTAPDAYDPLWLTISNSESTAWSDAVEYALTTLEKYSGYVLVKKEN